MTDLMSIPDDLPAPLDDGAADHLGGLPLPSLVLPATTGGAVAVSEVASDWLVLFVYPMTGRPDLELPDGWNEIPGARGCTPQACAFRDRHAELARLGAATFGLSVQEPDYQREMVARLELPFPVLSDHNREFGETLQLPTFVAVMPDGVRAVLYRRLTLIARRGVIEHVMYPVFPPDENAAEVEKWLRAQPTSAG
ncbi:MAG: peroxiredoxin [Gaiellaceae bacterium]